MNDASKEIKQGERFAFGENWSRFLSVLNEERIKQAEDSLKDMLELNDLSGKTFLDIGNGSGLFSLAARRLGATVHSFDFDTHSVSCALELKRRFFPGDPDWVIEQGSVLDSAYLAKLGKWDIVYSWGVLHHTGDLWKAMENVVAMVNDKGLLFIAIYNDEGYKSSRWARIKYHYNKRPWIRPILLTYGFLHFWGRTCLNEFLAMRPMASWRAYIKSRGMSPWHDLVDWMGGWPYEVATPDVVFNFCRGHGFTLQRLITRQGIGNNEFVFRKV
ncbi:MAG: class I SAM-dependent methyltransferase [Desulfomonilia bacterium]|jgi:2-polyprenyl-6-hydroxyphenyl methylase/3-demethylubiquinone-9 3-methyltransferase